jgi:hypothetical protein
LPSLTETKAGQELITIGFDKGILIGKIQEYELLVGKPVTEESILRSQPKEQLNERLNEPRVEFAKAR